MDSVVNVGLLRHPVSWLVVWSVLLIASAFFVVAHRFIAPPDAAVPMES